ncbi:MAG TPA: hypothetical protein VD907_06975 [Verrucomicrobiae bacterium]|nr:hypothetical protein [Verrucomicrobiae bacterium]
MSDTDHDEFDKAFENFGADPALETPPVVPTPAPAPAAQPQDPATPPAPAPIEPPKPAGEEPTPNEQPPAEPPKKEGEEATPQPGDAPTPQENPKPPETPETPPAPEEPKPLTEDSLRSIISEIRNEDRTSAQVLEATTQEVLNAYYPEGLSNVLVDESGRELRTPADVVEASGGTMSTDEAHQWLINEQYKLDQKVAKIKDDARVIAENTNKFKQDGIAVLQKYEPIFKQWPALQQQVWDAYKEMVKADEEKNVILSAPDMQKFYDLVLDPYRLAYEHAQGQPGTAPVAAPAAPVAAPETPPAPPTPSADDRLDVSGDGGASPVNDPNDFAQQVAKELANPN